MSTNVNINPESSTVEATRQLRKSGNSIILTIPPQVVQSLDLAPGDDVKITANWSSNEITAKRVE